MRPRAVTRVVPRGVTVILTKCSFQLCSLITFDTGHITGHIRAEAPLAAVWRCAGTSKAFVVASYFSGHILIHGSAERKCCSG